MFQHPNSWLTPRGRQRLDDRSRVAYAELLGDECKETCVAFMGRARDFYRGLGVEVERVVTDDGPGYRSRPFNGWLEAAGIERKHARPHSACDGLPPPMSRIVGVNNVMAHNS